MYFCLLYNFIFSHLFSSLWDGPVFILKCVVSCRTLFVRLSAGKPATQESSLDVFCHVIFDVNIDVMDVRGRPQEFVAL